MKQFCFLLAFLPFLAKSAVLDTSCMPEGDFFSERPEEKEKDQINRGERDFSVNLIKSLFQDFNATGVHENIFVGPSSIYATLMLAYFGAHGETEKELSNILGTNGEFSTLFGYLVIIGEKTCFCSEVSWGIS